MTAREIPLTQGRSAIVDAADFEWLSSFKWYADRHKAVFYAARYTPVSSGKEGKISMHRFIMDAPAGMVVDHINGDPLDNRRSNLRICTQSENIRNRRTANKGSTSKYLGVCWRKDCNKWVAQIFVDGNKIRLGMFADEIEAARAYDNAAREHFGTYASPNFGEAA